MVVFLQLSLLFHYVYTYCFCQAQHFNAVCLFDLIKFTKILTVNNVVRMYFAKDTSHFALTVKPETLRQG